MELQREIKKRKSAVNTNNNENNEKNKASSLSDDETAMLEMTLGMLRCSVCRDRFKNVAITRCFHLFCKECIDENLRNRHRKCPACGEKFGQDDVKTIYFGTHS
jgi:E3 ubiquitin-protein ligase BRE1